MRVGSGTRYSHCKDRDALFWLAVPVTSKHILIDLFGFFDGSRDGRFITLSNIWTLRKRMTAGQNDGKTLAMPTRTQIQYQGRALAAVEAWTPSQHRS